MRERLTATTLLGLALLLGPARPASAQFDPRVSVAGGYSILRESGPADVGVSTYDTGWTVMGSARLWRRIHGVGEFGAQMKKNTFDETQRLTAILGGPRASIVQFSRGAIYAQALFGVEMFSEPGFEESGFAIQPGAGVDWRLWKQTFVRAQVDYRWARQTAGNFNELRFFIGAGIGWP